MSTIVDPVHAGGTGIGDFFAIDGRAWALACQKGLNPAVAYLVLARGSGPDQRTTSWSVKAIETYTGIGRPRALKAIESLQRTGLVRITQRGTRPRYYVVPANEVPGCAGYPPPSLTSEEQKVFDQIVAGYHVPKSVSTADQATQWGTWWPRKIADQLVLKRWAQTDAGGRYKAIPYDAEGAAKPDWIWLPNSLITGAGENLVPPVELVRQTQNTAALQLLIDLYHVQNLADDGGVHWCTIRQNFDREMVGQRGGFIVYGFSPATLLAWGDRPLLRPYMIGEMEMVDGRQRDRGWKTFWDAFQQLRQLSLIDFVGHLIEADTANAEVIHPYAIGNGEASEQLVARAAHKAAEAMLTPGQRQWAEQHSLRLVPVRAHIAEAQMVGIARLRYRPRTNATAAWYARMTEWDEMAARFYELAAEASGLRQTG
ncbi:MAG: hypothetical protein JOY71_02765 [Acetobacteraceae bacterium]|nr:hypothetical protein [Acetobacteraceae bacterium]